MNKAKDKKEEINLKEEVVTTLTSQTINYMKQITKNGNLKSSLTNQKLTVIIVKR